MPGLTKRLAMSLLCLGAFAPPALAHPHVWVTASVDLVFNEQGQITAVNHAWSFDPAYAETAIEGMDANADGVYSPEELEPLTNENLETLKDYEYFTFLKVNGEKQPVADAVESSQLYTDGRLTLYFQVPLKTPIDPKSGDFMLKVYDPEFFIDFQFPEEEPVSIVGSGPAGCKLEVKPPPTNEEIEQTREMLSTKGTDWKPETPEDFGAMFARAIMYTCASS